LKHVEIVEMDWVINNTWLTGELTLCVLTDAYSRRYTCAVMHHKDATGLALLFKTILYVLHIRSFYKRYYYSSTTTVSIKPN
jgi:hypothetical protein